MKRSDTYWRIPRDWMLLLPLGFGPVIIGLLMLIFLRVLAYARENGSVLLLIAFASALIGITLLFIAKLPLYRQGRFFTFGPSALSRGYRSLYVAAYILLGFVGVIVAIVLVLLAEFSPMWSN